MRFLSAVGFALGVLTSIFATNVSAQTYFHDSFEDGDLYDADPVTWRLLQVGSFSDVETSMGELITTTEGATFMGVRQGGDWDRSYRDHFMETRTRIVEPSEEWMWFGLLARVGGGNAYGLGLNTWGELRYVTDVDGFLDEKIAQENLDMSMDWMLRLELQDDEFRGWAWPAETERPTTPAIIWNDDRLASGFIGLWVNTDGTPGTAAFSDVWVGELLPFDCNSDGKLTVADINCVDTTELSAALEAAGLLAGDANGDGEVAFDDLLALSSGFGSQGSCTEGDFDKDYFAEILASHGYVVAATNDVGAGTPVVSTPEASTDSSLLALSVLTLAMIQRGRWQLT